jgi:glyoxylase-like metal-dependent hydrolase (beta-lactamase superfamily II)
MRKLLVLAVAFIIAAASASLLSAQYTPTTKPLQIGQVPGTPIYYSIGSPGIPAVENEGNTSNAGFIVTADGVVVFDALGTPSLGWALLSEIRRVTDKPIRYVVVSHYHADHIYGLQAFRDHTSAVIIGQDRASEYKLNDATSDERADARLQQRRSALAPWVNEHTRVVPPDIAFSEKVTIVLGGKQFILHYAGAAHSASDLMMMVQPDGVLFAGDIVQNSRIPFMNSDDVNTERWLKSLEEVDRLRPNFIIPGHGRPMAQAHQAIAFTTTYIEFIRGAMKEAVENWTNFTEAYSAIDWSPYNKLPGFAENNRGNAYRIYLELEGAALRPGRTNQ